MAEKKKAAPLPEAPPEFGEEFQKMQAMQPAITDEEAEAFRAYVKKVRWQVAKTYSKTWPHAYTIRWWNKELDEEFCRLVLFIRANGVKERFYKAIRPYFYIDGYKYWTMGDPLETTWVLNRAPGVPNPFPPVKERKKKPA